MYILLAVLVFSFLIAFHEFGHMWVARRMGMRVERYSIGFGPALLAWRRGDTEYVISALPLGGYVRVAGMAVEDDVDPDDDGSYANKAAWRRLLVIGAGPFANYLLAYIVGVGLLLVGVSIDNLYSAKIRAAQPGRPAAKAGLVGGDEIREVGGTPVHDWRGLVEAINHSAKAANGQPIPVVVSRDGQTKPFQVQPEASGGGFIIGVEPSQLREPPLPVGQAVPQAAFNLWQQTEANADMIWKLISRQIGTSALSGPPGILMEAAEQAKKGLMDLMQLFWALSVAVGFFNLLPIPGLDGGRLVFLIYEVIARRRVNQRVEGIIHMVGLASLLVLMLVVSWGDIMRKMHGG